MSPIVMERTKSPWIEKKENIVKGKPHKHYQITHGWSLLGQPLEDAVLNSDLATTYESFHAHPGLGVTFEIEEALNWLLQNRVIIPEPAAVRDYLLRYPDMIGLLPLVCRAASQRFGTSAQLSLEVYRDPEIEDEYLTLYVRQESYEDSIMSMIEDVRAEYEGELARRAGWLLVTTDFRPPR